MQTLPGELQTMIRSSALDWLIANYPHLPRAIDGTPPARPDPWPAFASMGWLGLALPEDAGGTGGGPLEQGALMEAFGRHLVAEPYLACTTACQLLHQLGSHEQRSAWLPKVISGQARLALAHDEALQESLWSPRAMHALRDRSGWRLSGSKQMVEGAQTAAQWLVSATLENGRQALFLVDPHLAGIKRDDYGCLHGGQAADLAFDDVYIPADSLLGANNETHEATLRQILSASMVANCWGAAGAADMLVEQTARHTAQRKQFGRPLADFQAVQHKLAEMAVDSAEARAMCELASMRLNLAGEDAMQIATAAQVKVSKAVETVARHAVQLHGGMGVSEELPVAAGFRWLEAFQIRHGRRHVYSHLLGGALLEGGRSNHSAVLGTAT